jgi:ATP-binding cassette subfamily B protein
MHCSSDKASTLVKGSGIIISHKLNMVRSLSDEIIVLEKGAITERGTHKTLLENKGLYAKLVEKTQELIEG